MPIIIINTNNQSIQDNPKIVCDMGIIDNGYGNINSINEPYNHYEGIVFFILLHISFQQNHHHRYVIGSLFCYWPLFQGDQIFLIKI